VVRKMTARDRRPIPAGPAIVGVVAMALVLGSSTTPHRLVGERGSIRTRIHRLTQPPPGNRRVSRRPVTFASWRPRSAAAGDRPFVPRSLQPAVQSK